MFLQTNSSYVNPSIIDTEPSENTLETPWQPQIIQNTLATT